ncbi:MAG: HEAT repeat domain-containing protein [Chloroflexi bacterium]|nr:MAG: HEAT repeat domain-containing protein [Chloroflexota bacterium]
MADYPQLTNSEVIGKLLAGLNHPDPKMICRIIAELERMRNPLAINPLSKLAIDPTKAAQVRRCAVEALGKLGHNRAVDVLLQALDDLDAEVRQVVPPALAAVGDLRAVEPLMRVAHFDNDVNVRRQAIRYLGTFGDPYVIDTLTETLSDPDEMIRVAAVNALADLRDPSTLATLIEMFHRDESGRVRATIIAGVQLFPTGDYIDLCLIALQDADKRVRSNAVLAFGKTDDARVIEPLVNTLLNDDDTRTRGHAARVLGKKGDERAVEPLIITLRDSDPWTQECARFALADLDTPEAREALKYWKKSQ